MRRREFIALMGASVAWPFVALAQRAGKPPVVGFLAAGLESNYRPIVAAVVQRLGELGWIDRRNILIEYRYAEGSAERAGRIASEFAQMKVDVILTGGDAQVLAAKLATATTPIVFAAAGDPIGNGLVASLARPGGNVTGLSVVLSETAGKRLELLREVIPGLRRLAIIGNSANPTVAIERDAILAAAHALNLDTINSGFRRREDIAPAIEPLAGRADALYVCNDPLVNANAAHINEVALAARLPVMHVFPGDTEAGGLISYGPDGLDMWARSADMVDKILRGTKPADIPVEQPTKFDLVVNLKTAKAMGIAVPESLLVRADKVIE